MTQRIDSVLRDTLADLKMSRKERRQVRAVIRDAALTSAELQTVRARAFDLARDTDEPAATLDWLEDVVKALEHAQSPERDAAGKAQVYFSPGDGPRNAIIRLLRGAHRKVDLCVFTVTDNRLRDVIEQTVRRGVTVRLITDDDKSLDRGSDVEYLAGVGVDVVTDRTDAHMHHKFALFDDHTLLSGSYNWTRSAATENEENVLVTDDPRLVTPFRTEFDRLWTHLSR